MDTQMTGVSPRPAAVCSETAAEELKNCAFVKTVLMLLVVFYHSILFWSGSWFTANPAFSAPLLPLLSGWLNTVHIQGFALVSGYLFSYLKYEQGKYGQFLPFLKNKAKQLLIPYVFVAALWVLPIHCLFFQPDALTVIKNYVFAMGPGQLWFLVMLFVVFAMFWPLSDFFRKHDLMGAIVVLGMYGCSLFGGRIIPNVFQFWTAMGYIPLFWLGFKLRQHGTNIVRKIPAVLWLIASVLLYALTRYLGGIDHILCKLLAMGSTFVCKLVGAVTAFVVLQAAANKLNWNNKVFAFISKRSMTVYLFHQQVIYFVIAGLNGILNPYLHGIVNFVAAMAVSLGIATVLLRFRVTRFLIGEK